MKEAFFYGCVLFFSAYGIFSLTFFLRDFFGERKNLRGKCIYTLLPITEEELHSEEMVRTLIFQNYKNDTGICERKIIVLTEDKNSCNARRLRQLFEKESEVLVCGREQLWECVKME